ncbi:MAG: hypothetical protein M1834_003515 [Cirrosporium novae-zelandiae]|nr:MAG: hypothetical protein M1834_003515 [Cirrosporium novae-zelandiae]
MKWNTIWNREAPTSSTHSAEQEQHQPADDIEKTTEPAVVVSDPDAPNPNVQYGVQAAEAVTAVWSKRSLILTYICIFLVFFVNSFQQQMTSNLSAYVTSSFALHSLVSVTSVVSSIVGGVFKLPIAKLINIWGRAEGFCFMVVLATLGIILMACCSNVQTYAAAQVFYWVGYDGMSYVLDVYIADTSDLKNRALWFAFSTTPYIATTFAGPAAAEDFYENTGGWRWAFGTFAIVVPIISMPIASIFFYNQKKAKKLGVLVKQPSNRTLWESVIFYAIEFDVIGLLLVSAGFSLFLLPFSLEAYQAEGWKAGMIIAMLVIGFLCLVAFPFYLRYSPKPFIPFHLLLDRTVLGACLLAGTLFISFYIWDSYFSTYLQVVNDLSLQDAGYVANIYSIGSCFWAVVVGFLIRTSGSFKWLALCALPLEFLGSGLMIHFRQPNQDIGYVVMCQIFIAFAGGTLVICEEMAVMAASEHEQVAVVLALQALFSSIGGAIGSTISSALWTHIYPKKLAEYLPESTKDQATTIYGSLDVQLSYPVGSPTRIAIQKAMGVAQKYMTITATVILVLCIVEVMIWRNIKVKDFRQVKGTIA